MCCSHLLGRTAVNMGAAGASETLVLLARTYIHGRKIVDMYCPSFVPFDFFEVSV